MGLIDTIDKAQIEGFEEDSTKLRRKWASHGS